MISIRLHVFRPFMVNYHENTCKNRDLYAINVLCTVKKLMVVVLLLHNVNLYVFSK